jgi:hypothetical protein
MMRLTTRALGLLAVALAFSPGQARADLIFTMQEVGPDVVLTGSGTVNTAGLSKTGNGWTGTAEVQAGMATLVTATPTGGFTGTFGDWYKAITGGPFNFGSGGLIGGTSATGSDAFGLYGNSIIHDQGLYLPWGYVSGTPLSGKVTFSGQTFASLGVTPGTYTWTWGTGANADSAVLQIGPTSPAVPEPSGLALLGAGAVALVGCARWRRRGRAG